MDDYDIIENKNEEFVNTFIMNVHGKLQNKKYHESINEILSNNIFFFNANEYVTDIKKSYENNYESIYKQWTLDFPREIVMLDNKKISDSKFIEFATSHNLEKVNNDILFYMLVTQAMFYFPFVAMQNLYEKTNIIIMDDGKYKICNFINSKQTITMKFILILNLFNMLLEKSIKKIETEMVIDFNNDTKKINKYGILTWKFIN